MNEWMNIKAEILNKKGTVFPPLEEVALLF